MKSTSLFFPLQLLILITFGSIRMSVATSLEQASSYQFSAEQQLTHLYPEKILPFWQQGEFSSFAGVNNIEIHYAKFVSSSNTKCLVIVPGRSESYLKYQELSYDLFKLGFNLFIIDHRGQGLSGRMLQNRDKGYVESFDYYSDDLDTFISNIVEPSCANDTYLLAHSMGGAIAARYMQRFPNKIKAAVLSSPMISINDGGLPDWLATSIIKTGNLFSQWFASEPWYFLGQSNYQDKAFEGNALSQSAIRYQYFADLYQATPQLHLGGVTFNWLSESLNVREDLFNDVAKLSAPTLILQAGGDTVVDNQAQNDFCQVLHQAHPHSCPDGKAITINDALHEIFFEQDSYRNLGLSKALEWFSTF